jgi:hypothetical protein
LAVRILLIAACQRASSSGRYSSSTAKSALTSGSFSAAIVGGLFLRFACILVLGLVDPALRAQQ